MKKYFFLPLIFLFIAASIGTLLRWHFIAPIKGLHFQNWLHAHSHIMFLGWIFNFMLLAYVRSYSPSKWSNSMKNIFMAMQVMILGMMISFPLQGYGTFSIILSVLHIFVSLYFCYRFLRSLDSKIQSTSLLFIRASLLFFVFSSIGAISIGPIVANGLQQTKWYFFAVYFFLHFQYNGVFIFGVFGLFFRQLESKGIQIDELRVKRIFYTLFIACFLAYFLSVLWSERNFWIITLSLISVWLQVGSYILFAGFLRDTISEIKSSFHRHSLLLLNLVAAAYLLKIILQLLSAIPSVAIFASQVRFFVLAYLHLVLIGIVSFYLLSWLLESNYLRNFKPVNLLFLITGFIGSEVCMLLAPLVGSYFTVITYFLFIFSLFMTASFGGFILSFLHKRKALD